MTRHIRHFEPDVELTMGPGCSMPVYEEEDERSEVRIDRDEESFLWSWGCVECQSTTVFQRAATLDDALHLARLALAEHNGREHSN